MMDRVLAKHWSSVFGSNLDGVGEMAHGRVADAKNQGQSYTIIVVVSSLNHCLCEGTNRVYGCINLFNGSGIRSGPK